MPNFCRLICRFVLILVLVLVLCHCLTSKHVVARSTSHLLMFVLIFNIDSPSHRHQSFQFQGATDFHCYDTLYMYRLSLNNRLSLSLSLSRSHSLYKTIIFTVHISFFFHLAKYN